MNNILKSDFYRLFRSKAFYICTAVAVLFMSLNIFILYWASKTVEGEMSNYYIMPKDGITFGLSVFSNGNNLIIIGIFAAIFVAAEFAHGTMKNAVSKGFSRVLIYGSKLITIMAATFLMHFVNFIIGTLICTVLTGNLGSFTGEFVANMFKIMGIELLLNFALAALFVFIGMVIRNLGGVIAINVIGVLSVEPLIYTLLELLFDHKVQISNYSLLNNIARFIPSTTAAGSDYLRAVIVAAAYLVISAGIGIFAFRKSDVK